MGKSIYSYKELVTKLYTKEYESEFKVIDGLNQHPEGLTFKEWIKTRHDFDL